MLSSALPCDPAVAAAPLPPFNSWPPPAGALSSALPYGPAVADHCLLIADLPPLQKVQGQPLGNSQKAALQQALRDWELWLDRCEPWMAVQSSGISGGSLWCNGGCCKP